MLNAVLYHWAMVARYGKYMYWSEHPERALLPDGYEAWYDRALARYGLEDIYEFIDKQ